MQELFKSIPPGTLTYTSKWEKNEEGVYERNIKTYEMKDLKEETVIEMINTKPIDEITFEDIFKEAKFEETQIGLELTDEEINKPGSIQATVYSEDTNDVIFVKESIGKNILVTFFWIIVELMSCGLVHSIRNDWTGYSFLNNMEEITDEYKQNATEFIRKRDKLDEILKSSKKKE